MIGVCYYPEHWDLSRMEYDIKTMSNNGINIVRVGEFMWDKLEPNEGMYDFSILDSVFKLCGKYGLKIIIGTPSASPPLWIVNKYPDILQKDSEGRVRKFSGRRHYCYNSSIYIYYVDIIVEKLAKRYGSSDILYAWQIDNEFGVEDTADCYCEKCDKAFQIYLKEAYNSINKLNDSWGTSFWSQSYNSFYDIETPKKIRAAVNPHRILDFYRFNTVSINKFAQHQINTIRKYSDKPVTTNYVGNFTDVDYYNHSKLYDFISFDNYMPQMEFDYCISGFNLDLIWSMKRKPFTIMEQQPGRVNWQIRNGYYPADMLKPVSLQTFYHGADNLLYFRYRAVPYGGEQYHAGILNYDGIPENSSRLSIVKELAEDVKNIPKRPKSDTAIYFDYEVGRMHSINHVSKDFSYTDAVIDIYRALRYCGRNIDIVFNDSEIKDYELVVIPYAFYIPDVFYKMFDNYSGKLLITCMSGTKDKDSRIISHRPLGLNIRGLDFDIEDFGAIYKEEILYENDKLVADYWIEKLKIRKGNATAVWNGTPLDKEPAVVSSPDQNTLYTTTVFDTLGWQKIFKIWLGWDSLADGNFEYIKNNNEKHIINYNLNRHINDIYDKC